MRPFVSMLFLFVGCAGSAMAQTSFSLAPAESAAGQNVNLRIDDPSACLPAPQIDVQRAGDVVTVNVHITDAGPCLPEWATPRFVSLGTFAPGTYQVRAFLCSNAPPPLPACELSATLPLIVFELGGPTTIPALSTTGLVLLALSAMLLARRGPMALVR